MSHTVELRRRGNLPLIIGFDYLFPFIAVTRFGNGIIHYQTIFFGSHNPSYFGQVLTLKLIIKSSRSM